MSYIDLTGIKITFGQTIDVVKTDGEGIDIFFCEGRVHIDEEDTDILRERLFGLKEI